MKILIVRLSALGDVIHGIPAAMLLKEAIPNLELTWLVESAAMDVLIQNPAVDRVIVFPKKAWKAQLRTVPGALEIPFVAARFASELRRLHFDAAIDLQGLLKSALLMALSGAPRRFGFKTGREGSHHFLTDCLDPGDYFSPAVHVVDLNLQMANFVIRNLCGGMSDKSEVGATKWNPNCGLSQGTVSDAAPEIAVNSLLSSPTDIAPKQDGTASGICTTGGTSTTGGSVTTCGSDNENMSHGLSNANSLDSSAHKDEGCTSDDAVNSVNSGTQEVVIVEGGKLKTHSYIYELKELTTWSNRNGPGIFSLPAPPAESSDRMQRMVSSGSSAYALQVVLIPGTTWSSKIWPVEHWAVLGKLLREHHSARFILVGGPAELASNLSLEQSLRESTAGGGVINLTGATSLTDLVALFKNVDLVIGADTGPLHLAAAVGAAPVLGVFGSTPVARNGPYGEHSHSIALRLECQPCFKKVCPLGTNACLTELRPQAVLEAALKLV